MLKIILFFCAVGSKAEFPMVNQCERLSKFGRLYIPKTKTNFKTVREKLNETHDWLQKSYGFEAKFFKEQIEYRLDTVKEIMLAYAGFANLKFDDEKEYLFLVKTAYNNIKELKELNFNVSFYEQNNSLNRIKSNIAQAYWLFTQFVEGKNDGYFEKSFDQIRGWR
ncbi:hypothetical protein HRG84_07715 [Flavisolibacter sp. BT320]|nr:hypothetical protein [Flavisolibacter longurius]